MMDCSSYEIVMQKVFPEQAKENNLFMMYTFTATKIKTHWGLSKRLHWGYSLQTCNNENLSTTLSSCGQMG